MFHVITGGSGSGKSAFAEEQVLRAGEGKRIYIATMIPYGEDGRARVERHRKMRQKKQFETVECYLNLKRLAEQLTDMADGAEEKTTVSESVFSGTEIVLLECMSNLTANEIFEPEGAHEHVVESVMEGIRMLKNQVKHLYVVTNEVFSDGIDYDAQTQQYLSCLGQINQAMAEEADVVTEVVYGIPVTIKNEEKL